MSIGQDNDDETNIYIRRFVSPDEARAECHCGKGGGDARTLRLAYEMNALLEQLSISGQETMHLATHILTTHLCEKRISTARCAISVMLRDGGGARPVVVVVVPAASPARDTS